MIFLAQHLHKPILFNQYKPELSCINFSVSYLMWESLEFGCKAQPSVIKVITRLTQLSQFSLSTYFTRQKLATVSHNKNKKITQKILLFVSRSLQTNCTCNSTHVSMKTIDNRKQMIVCLNVWKFHSKLILKHEIMYLKGHL